jgi:hypothetical protein
MNAGSLLCLWVFLQSFRKKQKNLQYEGLAAIIMREAQ